MHCYFMSSEQEFDDLISCILDVVQRCHCDGVRVDDLQRTLCKRYGSGHFRQEDKANLLTAAVEYLLYTKRVDLRSPVADNDTGDD